MDNQIAVAIIVEWFLSFNETVYVLNKQFNIIFRSLNFNIIFLKI
jgi:hypothetical protein